MEITEELVTGITKIANKNITTLYGVIEEWQTRKVIEAMMMLNKKLQEKMDAGNLH